MTVRPAKTQISLGIHPVWSESSLSTWRKLGSLAHWAQSKDSNQSGRMLRLMRVFAERIIILLVLSCRGSNAVSQYPAYIITNMGWGMQWYWFLIRFWPFYRRSLVGTTPCYLYIVDSSQSYFSKTELKCIYYSINCEDLAPILKSVGIQEPMTFVCIPHRIYSYTLNPL